MPTRQRPEHTTASPWVHRVVHMPAHYSRAPADRIGHDPFVAYAVVLSLVPISCPRCHNPCLQDRGLEMSCLPCGWEQIVRP